VETPYWYCWQLIAGYSSGAHQLPTRFHLLGLDGAWPSLGGDHLPHVIPDGVCHSACSEGASECSSGSGPLDAPRVGVDPRSSTWKSRRRVEVNRTVGRTHDPHEGSSVHASTASDAGALWSCGGLRRQGIRHNPL